MKQHHERMREFEGPVMDAALNNALLYRVIQEYAHGRIVTKEEALCQMVVLLSKDWTAQQERMVQLMMTSTQVMVPPHSG